MEIRAVVFRVAATTKLLAAPSLEAGWRGGRSVAMFTSRSCLHAGGNGLGNLEMAASLDFFDFQQIGWK
jgi:hypothetical protein